MRPKDKTPAGETAASARPKRSRWRVAGRVLLVVVVVLGAVRLALPHFVRDYVIRTLDQSPMYDGRIGDVTLHLWRGAYTIEDIRVVKTTGNVPVPFFAAKRLDFSLEWSALLHGKAVGRVKMEKPEMNFVDAENASDAQSGAGMPWLKVLRDLFPFRIDSTEVHDGEVHFRAFHTEPPVDVYLSQVEGAVENLTNVYDETTPLFAKVHATAKAMDQASFEYQMRLDAFSYRPTFTMAVRLLGLDVTKTNDLALAYGKFDFERGWMDLVVELDAKEGRVEGYVKPLYRELAVFDLKKDIRGGNFLGAFWQALLGLAKDVFKNQRRDQVATVIPLTGDLSGPNVDILATLGNILHNAFVRAYLPTLQSTPSSGITFGPASIEQIQASAAGR